MSVLSIILAVVLPLYANWRFRSAQSISLAILTFYLLVVAIVVGAVDLGFAHLVSSQFSQQDTAYYDTYYVVAHEHYFWSLALLWVLITTGVYLEDRFGKLQRKIILILSLWGIHLGLIASTSALSFFASFAMPRRYTDYSDYFAQISFLQGLASYWTMLSLLALISFILISLAIRLRRS